MKNLVINLTIIFISVFALAGCNLLYTNYVQHATEQKFCGVINLAVSSYESNPAPTTKLGLALRDDYFKLQKDLECD